MPANGSTPDTIVLIHGFWVTPRSWENWITHYENKGYRVLAPAYPGFEVEVEALNADPSPIVDLTVPQILEHLENVVGELDSPPIIMGHSAGGVFTQLLLDRGHGAAAVAINSAPPEGIPVVPLSQIKSTFSVLRSPANRHKGGRVHARAVALRVHEHVQRGGVPRSLRAVSRPRLRRDLLGQHPGERQAWPPGHVGRLQQRRACAAAVHLGQ